MSTQKIIMPGLWLTAGFFTALTLRYQWACFWRPSRRRTWLLGLAGLAILIALPVCCSAVNHCDQWIWPAGGVAAVAMPGIGVLSSCFSREQRYDNTLPGLGWWGLFGGALIGIMAALLLLQPVCLIA